MGTAMKITSHLSSCSNDLAAVVLVLNSLVLNSLDYIPRTISHVEFPNRLLTGTMQTNLDGTNATTLRTRRIAVGNTNTERCVARSWFYSAIPCGLCVSAFLLFRFVCIVPAYGS